jgi:hypothetical protein
MTGHKKSYLYKSGLVFDWKTLTEFVIYTILTVVHQSQGCCIHIIGWLFMQIHDLKGKVSFYFSLSPCSPLPKLTWRGSWGCVRSSSFSKSETMPDDVDSSMRCQWAAKPEHRIMWAHFLSKQNYVMRWYFSGRQSPRVSPETLISTYLGFFLASNQYNTSILRKWCFCDEITKCTYNFCHSGRLPPLLALIKQVPCCGSVRQRTEVVFQPNVQVHTEV